MTRFAWSIVLLLTLFVVTPLRAQETTLTIVATTTLLADVAQNVGGDLVSVTALVPRDADAHAFQPTPQNAAAVARADLLLVVGAGYETFLGGLLDSAGRMVEPVVVSNGIDMLGFGSHEHEGEEHTEDEAHEHEGAEHIGVLGNGLVCSAHEEGEEHADEGDHDHGECDPHVWMNPLNVKIWVSNIAEAFAAADPAHAETYRANAEAYNAQLDALDAEIRAIVSAVPEDHRVLVTNHEFMGYFADAYGFEVVGTVIPGITTESEPNPQDLAALIKLVNDKDIRAIFAEVSANSRLAEVIAEEAGIAVVNTLYSESLSALDGSAPTYLAFMRHNATTIAAALQQE